MNLEMAMTVAEMLDAKNSEIVKLRAEVAEAEEIIKGLLSISGIGPYDILCSTHKTETGWHDSYRARAFLDRTGK